MGRYEKKQMQQTAVHTKVEAKQQQHIFRLSA